MNSPLSEELPRGQLARDSMEACEPAAAEARFLELLGSRADAWANDEFGWRPWLRTRPRGPLVLGRAGGGSCFVFSPSEHAGFWAVLRDGMRGQGALTETELQALEAIAAEKGIPVAPRPA